MRKLSLKLDELAVETFELGRDGMERGTVHAHATVLCTERCDTDGPTCNGGYTCGVQTCGGGLTCNFISCANCTGQCGTGEYSCNNNSCVYTCIEGC